MAPKSLAGILLVIATFYPVIITGQSRGEEFRGPTNNVRGYLNGRSQQYQSQPFPEFYQQQSQSQSFSNSALNSPPYPDYQRQPALYSQFMQQFAYQPAVNIPPPFNYNPNQPSYSEYYDPPPTPLYANPPARPIASYPKPPDYSQTYHPIETPVNNRPSTQNYNRPKPQAEPYNPPSSTSQSSPEYYNKDQTQQNSNLDNRFGPEEASSAQDQSTLVDQFTTRPTRKGSKRPLVTPLPPRFDNRDDAVFKKALTFDGELSNSMEIFALELIYNFNNRLENENFMISPFSIYHLLVLIAEGAKGNTLNELTNELKLVTLERTRDFQQYLSVALNRNTADVVLKKFAMMVTDRARPVNPEYETRVEKVYEADVLPVNFFEVDNSIRTINNAVKNYTDGQITDTVKKEDLFKAQLILISGLFFQGKWMNVFNTSFTKAEPFYDTNGVRTGDVNMMFQRGPFAYAGVADLGCHILELPYAEMPLSSRNDVGGSTGLSMILVLPRKGLSLTSAIENVHKFGMAKLYAELYKSKVEYEDDEIEVHLPRFEITTALDVKDILEGMEIRDLFNANAADLSNINKQYFVSSMIHKTKISVDEYGTTAAAVTTSIFANKATPPKFHANKPFLFFVVDKVTNLILFSGQYVTPSLF